jgi:hypothetical protein
MIPGGSPKTLSLQDILEARPQVSRPRVEESVVKLCRFQLIEKNGGHPEHRDSVEGFYLLAPGGRGYLVHAGYI